MVQINFRKKSLERALILTFLHIKYMRCSADRILRPSYAYDYCVRCICNKYLSLNLVIRFSINFDDVTGRNIKNTFIHLNTVRRRSNTPTYVYFLPTGSIYGDLIWYFYPNCPTVIVSRIGQ